MKKVVQLLFASLLLLVLSSVAFAKTMPVRMYSDAAPNVYGSADYAPWEAAAFAAIASGSFADMGNGINPANVGTNKFEIQDEVVYSFGDLGKRLTWLYWMPGETVESLTDRLTISLFNTWDGDSLDFYDYYYGSTWITPSKIYNYDANGDGIIDGVMGVAGMAWWGANGVDTQEALDNDIEAWGSASEEWLFTVKLDGVEFSYLSVRDGAVPTPEPSSFLLLGAGLLGLVALGRKKFSN